MSEQRRRLITNLKSWLIASAAGYVLASIAHSQMVLHGLAALDIPIPVMDRLRMTVTDIGGLNAYLIVISLGFGIAFVVMGGVARWLPLPDRVVYPLAGALAMLTILLSMKQLLQITPIAGARGTAGLVLQMLAGVAGGWVFAYWRSRSAGKAAATAGRRSAG